jgi:hypothetical protein
MPLAKLLPIVLLAGCVEADVVEPLLGDSTPMLRFDLSGTGNHSFTYDVDTTSYAVAGSRIDTANGVFCRARLEAPGHLGDPAAASLGVVLESTTLVTLGEDSCRAVFAGGCGGPPDGDFVGVTVDGAYFSTAAGCSQLVAPTDLVVALDDAFASLGPISEQVEWDGQEWRETGRPCPTQLSID